MKSLRRKIKIVYLLAAAFALGCVGEEEIPVDASAEKDVTANSSASESPAEEPSSSGVNTGATNSFTLYETVCELVHVSCGNGGVYKHLSTNTEVIDDNRVVTHHQFENPNGQILEVTEGCGVHSEANGANFSSGECRIQGLIKGDAFVVVDGEGQLVEVFRTDLAGSSVTNAYGQITQLSDLQELKAQWDDIASELPANQQCTSRQVGAGTCSGNTSLYQ